MEGTVDAVRRSIAFTPWLEAGIQVFPSHRRAPGMFQACPRQVAGTFSPRRLPSSSLRCRLLEERRFLPCTGALISTTLVAPRQGSGPSLGQELYKKQ